MKHLSPSILSVLVSVTAAVAVNVAGSYACASAAPAPRVSVKKQIVTPQLIAFQPLSLTDPKTGEELLLAQHIRPSFGSRVSIALYDTKGNQLLSQPLAFLPDAEDYSWISDARFNERGELIVLHTVSKRGAAGMTSVTSHNLTQKTAVKLHANTERASILGRVVEAGRTLVAIENERSEIFKQWDRKVDVIDEATGAVVRTIPLEQSLRARFGMGRNGTAKLLVTGYVPRDWKSIDIATGAETPIAISEEEALGQTDEIKTVLGETLALRTNSELTFVDRSALMDGVILRRHVFPVSSQFLGSEPYALVAEKTDRDLVIRDLKSGLQIGQTLPAMPAFPWRPSGTSLLSGLGSVEGLLLTKKNKIVVIEEPVVPNSYMPGSVLSYFNLETGKLLRRQKLELYKLSADLVEDERGHVLVVERDFYNSRRKRATNLVVDLTAKQVLRKIADDAILFHVMKSESGRVVQAGHDDKGQMCFADLKAPEVQTCVGLPSVALVGGSIRGERKSPEATTFRTDVLNSRDNYNAERGWVEFSVR